MDEHVTNWPRLDSGQLASKIEPLAEEINIDAAQTTADHVHDAPDLRDVPQRELDPETRDAIQRARDLTEQMQ
ncbi:MAG: hypothetical protein ABEI52_00020, partial [Halobacteriaceae archaeon]